VRTTPGTLEWWPILDRLDLVAPVVARAVGELAFADEIMVAAIDPELADTAAFCERYDVTLEQSANCVVMVAKRSGARTNAAGILLATTRLDVNGVIRRRLDARKASFAPLADAEELSAMEYGAITPSPSCLVPKSSMRWRARPVTPNRSIRGSGRVSSLRPSSPWS
jgi:hypothetical protein